MKLLLQGTGKLTKAHAEAGNAHRRNPFVPGVLIVGRHRKNLLQKHLGRETCSGRGKLRTTVSTEQAGAHDGRGQGRTGNPGEQDGPVTIEQANCREGGTQHDARLHSDSLGKGFVFANDTEPRQGGDNVNARLAGGLTEIGDDGFVRFKWHALFQLPAQQRNRFFRGTWEILEVLNEYANYGI